MRTWRPVIPCILGVVLVAGAPPWTDHLAGQGEGQRGELLQMFQGQRGRRRQELLKHLTTHPRDANAHFELGQLYALDGHTDSAIQAYRTVVEITPDHETAHFNLGLLYHGAGQFGEAVSSFREVLRLNPQDLPTHINLGVAYRHWREDLVGKEIAILEAAVALRPEYPEGHFHLGMAYRTMGELQAKCRPWYEKARAELAAFVAFKPAGRGHEKIARWIGLLERRLAECE
jgi:tetratricopeptide (TPR) repeat protein